MRLACQELNMTNSTLSKDQFIQLVMIDRLYGLALVEPNGMISTGWRCLVAKKVLLSTEYIK